MENNNGLASIRKKNKDVFGRSNRRFPVIIVGAVLIALLFVVSMIVGNGQKEEIKQQENRLKQINAQITALEKKQGQLSDDKIDIGALMSNLPTSNTVNYETIMVELRDYIEMTGIDATIAAIAVNSDADLPEVIKDKVSENVTSYECSLTVEASQLQLITKLLTYIYEGDTFYYLDYLNVETSGEAASANIKLYTFAVEN